MSAWADEIALIRSLLDYDQASGVFRWRTGRGRMLLGSIAGRTHAISGYIYVCVARRQYLAHRLAWAMVSGALPDGEIDHRDGNRTNNAIVNLRQVDRAGNSRNRHFAGRGSKTGLLGVCTNPSTLRFRARIVVDRAPIHLGYFDTPEQAHAAYVEAKRRLHSTNEL